MPRSLASFERATQHPSLFAQDYHGQALERRSEHALAGHVEIVAVDQREHGLDLEQFDAGGDHAPYLDRLAVAGHDVREGAVRSLQAQAAGADL